MKISIAEIINGRGKRLGWRPIAQLLVFFDFFIAINAPPENAVTQEEEIFHKVRVKCSSGLSGRVGFGSWNSTRTATLATDVFFCEKSIRHQIAKLLLNQTAINVEKNGENFFKAYYSFKQTSTLLSYLTTLTCFSNNQETFCLKNVKERLHIKLTWSSFL